MSMDKQLRITLLLIIDSAFAIIELVSGYAVHSLALVADSFHMFNDILSLIVALWAVRAAKSGSSPTFSYGLQRAEILGALVNAVFLLALCVTICLEAIQRIIDPPVVTNPVLILVVGCFGLLSNIVGLFLFNEHGHSHGGGGHNHSHGHSMDAEEAVGSMLPESALAREEQLLLANSQGYGATGNSSSRSTNTHNHNHGITEHSSGQDHGHNHEHENHTGGDVHSHSHGTSNSRPHGHEEHHHTRPRVQDKSQRSMNMEGVFLHVLGDALGNIGVIVTALFIWKTDYTWRFYMDPAVSLLITAIIFSTALPLCLRASKVLLQATPSSVNCTEVQQDIQSLPGVEEIHDLHIWQLSEDQLVATLHVTLHGPPEQFGKLANTIQECMAGYNIPSVTIQPEFADDANCDPRRVHGARVCETNGNRLTDSSHHV